VTGDFLIRTGLAIPAQDEVAGGKVKSACAGSSGDDGDDLASVGGDASQGAGEQLRISAPDPALPTGSGGRVAVAAEVRTYDPDEGLAR